MRVLSSGGGTMTKVGIALAVLMAGVLAAADTVQAQPLGTFRWQQEPYCNVLTLNVVQNGGVYQLTGFDDECGAPARSAANGTAFQNPDGSIGMGLTVITPSGQSMHLDATFSISTLSGTWRSDTNATGPWVFTPGPGHPADARPAPSSTVVIEGPGVGLPVTTELQRQVTALNETIVTPRAGRWSINKLLPLSVIACVGENQGMLFITVDGVPIRNSVVYAGPAGFSGVLSGVTLNPISAGAHVLGIGAQCFSGAGVPTSVNVSVPFTSSSVTVLP